MFSQKNEKERNRRQFHVRGLQTRRMRHYFGICDTGMFSLTVTLCGNEDDDDDDDVVAESIECPEGFRMLERTPTRIVTSDGVLFPQSDSPICRVV